MYVIFWINVIQSYLFARLYEGKESFKTLLDTKLFENNQTFNKIYGGVLGTFIGGLYNFERRNEGTIFLKRVKEELIVHKTHATHTYTPEQSFELQKKIEDHIRSRGDLDLPILTAEKAFTDAVKAVAGYMGG